MMKDLTTTLDSTNEIKGVTLEERAKLVLRTLGRTPSEIKKAYRQLARKHHPDTSGGNKENFQVIAEAYILLTGGLVPREPLLADDDLLLRIIGRDIAPLIDKQKEWKEYEQWRRKQFYDSTVW